MDWKVNFNKDIKRKLQAIAIEFNNYQDTQQIIHLQQSCEKLFSVVENHLMLKYNRKFSGYKPIYKMVEQNVNDRDLLADAFFLHQFFYNGEGAMPVYLAEHKFKSVYRRIKNRISTR